MPPLAPWRPLIDEGGWSGVMGDSGVVVAVVVVEEGEAREEMEEEDARVLSVDVEGDAVVASASNSRTRDLTL